MNNPSDSPRELRIALYPGDGIGPEVIAEAVRVANRAAELTGDISLAWTEFDWGMAHFHRHGTVVPADFLEQLRPFEAILLGAVGWPAELPDHETLAPLVRIRQAFDQYACVRPARLLPGVRSPLAGKGPADIDFLVIRENSEGEYVDQGGRLFQGHARECAVQTAVHTRKGIERILRYAFELAAARRGKLCMATKSNALRYAYVLWDEILAELAPSYPGITATREHCDALLMNLTCRPERYDVIVASNLFGDLLTDLGGAIAGGLGLAPSTNTNPERIFPSMFEPVHGSAPDIAGRGIANPIAAILSAALMFDHLRLPLAAERIRSAAARALQRGAATADLGGRLTTREMGEAVLSEMP